MQQVVNVYGKNENLKNTYEDRTPVFDGLEHGLLGQGNFVVFSFE